MQDIHMKLQQLKLKMIIKLLQEHLTLLFIIKVLSVSYFDNSYLSIKLQFE